MPMIAMLVLQNAPRFRMFVVGWYLQLARAEECDSVRRSFARKLVQQQSLFGQSLICVWRRTDFCGLLQKALVLLLVLLLVS